MFILYVFLDISEYDKIIEDSCLRAIKLSLEKSVVPIWKFLILFYVYLRKYLGNVEISKEPIKLSL